MKEIFEAVRIEVIAFDSEDIITTSGAFNGDDDEFGGNF